MTVAKIFDPSDVSDLPKELRGELKYLSRDEFERNIIEMFRHPDGGQLNIDQMMIGYYRLYHEVVPRKKMVAKLYNMAKSDRPAVAPVPSRKGVYKLILEEGDD